MKRLFLLGVLSCLLLSAFAQVAPSRTVRADTSKNKAGEDSVVAPLRQGGIYNLNVANGTLSNWAAGGDDFSLTITSYLNLFSYYKEGKHSWDNTLDFNFGYVNTTSLGARKNDDRLDILSKYGYGVSTHWNLAALVNFRTQLANGYNYEDDVETLTSAFMSPGYIIVSIGMDYKPGQDFSLFLSPITGRWVIVKDDSLSAKGQYGVEPGETSLSEIGAFLSANYIKKFSESIQYRGRLDLFSNYKNNPQNIDVFMTNVLSFSVSKVLTASWNFDLIYDDDVKAFGKNGTSPALQIKSLIGIGLQVKF
jgi:hypothetical protein